MNSQKRNTRNLNLKEENSSRFIFRNYSGPLLKSSFNSVLPRLLFFFFFLSLSNVLFLYHSFPPCTLSSVHRKGSPSSSRRWRRRFYRQPVDVYHINRIAMTGWALCVVRRAPLLKPVWKPLLNCQNLATWFSYIATWWNQFKGSWRFDAHQWNSCATRESSRAIILKSRFFSTGHSAWTSKVREIFWSSDLCIQWLMTADLLECSLTLRTPQFNDGTRP